MRRGDIGAVQFVPGDFLAVASQVPAATLVTLDRVICCYPLYRPLLEESLKHAERYVAFRIHETSGTSTSALPLRTRSAGFEGIRSGRLFIPSSE